MKGFWDLKLHGNRNRQRYLDNTDWIVIREAEGGDIEDQATRDKRQLARDEISLINATTSNPQDDKETIESGYDTIKHLTIEF